jgi:hypothetical protein
MGSDEEGRAGAGALGGVGMCKALYRRAKAHSMLGHWRTALSGLVALPLKMHKMLAIRVCVSVVCVMCVVCVCGFEVWSALGCGCAVDLTVT